MYRQIRTLLLAATIVAVAPAVIFADVPSQITAQGVLKNPADGTPREGTFTFTFKIFDNSVNGSQIWPGGPGGEDQSITITAPKKGAWLARVGEVIPLTDDVFAATVRWLEITVDDGPGGIATETLERIRLNTSPYSYRASTVDGASGGNITSKVSIGSGHTNTGASGFVAGQDNTVSADYGTVGGGVQNTVSNAAGTIAGGSSNICSGQDGFVGGGWSDTASGYRSVVGGGVGNRAEGTTATVAGGAENKSFGQDGFVGGGWHNNALGYRSSVVGGSEHRAEYFGFVGGGRADTASADYSAVVGGLGNRIRPEGAYGFIGGGTENFMTGQASTIAGGAANSCTAQDGFLGGGYNNSLGNTVDPPNTTGYRGVLCGGSSNFVTGQYGVISGGFDCRAYGDYAAVPGGDRNAAAGDYSFAAGRRALAFHNGAFVWGDSSDFQFPASGELNFTPGPNNFLARAIGGVVFVSAIDGTGKSTAGVKLAAGGGSWSSLSDKNAKENYEPVDGTTLLNKLSTIPVGTWNYKAQDESIRHIGPMAQDFHSAFGVGEDERFITTTDADGVALAAIQALYERSKRVDNLEAEVRELKSVVALLIAGARDGYRCSPGELEELIQKLSGNNLDSEPRTTSPGGSR